MPKKPEQPEPLPTKEVFFEFPSVVVARLVKNKSASFFDKIRSVFEVEINSKPNENCPYRYSLKGIVSDVDLVVSMLKDMSHEAVLLATKESLTTKHSVQDKQFEHMEQYSSIAFPGYASRRGEEKRMQRIALQAANTAADNVRRTFSVVASGNVLSVAKSPAAPASKQGATAALAAPAIPTARLKGLELTPYEPRNQSSALLYTALRSNDTQIGGGIGPAGSSKTVTALFAGYEGVLRGEFGKVILFRPRVTTNRESIGAVKGDLRQKAMPYMEALESNFRLVTGEGMSNLMNRGVLEADTGDTVRGATLRNAFIIVDEAENFEVGQFKSIATRIGENSRMVFTGDISAHQSDLHLKESGLVHMIHYFNQKAEKSQAMRDGLSMVRFHPEDSKARHPFLTEIIGAYDEEVADYIPIRDKARNAHEKQLEAEIEHNRQLALRKLEILSSITENKYINTVRNHFPAIFGTDIGKVTFLQRSSVLQIA